MDDEQSGELQYALIGLRLGPSYHPHDASLDRSNRLLMIDRFIASFCLQFKTEAGYFGLVTLMVVVDSIVGHEAVVGPDRATNADQ